MALHVKFHQEITIIPEMFNQELEMLMALDYFIYGYLLYHDRFSLSYSWTWTISDSYPPFTENIGKYPSKGNKLIYLFIFLLSQLSLVAFYTAFRYDPSQLFNRCIWSSYATKSDSITWFFFLTPIIFASQLLAFCVPLLISLMDKFFELFKLYL